MTGKLKQKQKEPSPEMILDTVYAFRNARVLLTAYELGVFTAIGDTPQTAAGVAALIKTDERATDRLMDALCGLGLLRKKSGKFSNTPLSARFLVEGKPGYMAGLMHSVHLWRSWSTLTDAVRAGTTVVQREALNERQVNWLDAFIAAMIEIAELAQKDPKAITSCPKNAPIGRPDEVKAAREPDLASLA